MSGTVYLVGAGPGDPGLITRRALDLIAEADAILYDRLVPPGVFEGARPNAELRYVGKRPGEPSVPQEEINRMLVELARAGRCVVRLKGGDPFVFGRGGEEAQALAAAGVAFEVVPGVTAGVAAPAYAGIPVTHRDDASAVAFVTGHEDPEKPDSALDWAALAAVPGTLLLYMGVPNLQAIAGSLIEPRESEELDRALEGIGDYSLVCLTSPNGATLLAEGLMRRGRDARSLAGTVVAAIGPGTAAELARFGIGADVIPERSVAEALVEALSDTPIEGRRVLVARAAEARQVLSESLRQRGAEVDVVTLYETRAEPLPEDRLRAIADADYVTFTSSSTVRYFMSAAGSLPGGARVVSIGPV